MNNLWSKGFEYYLKKFLRKYKCHLCGGDLYFFNGGAYNNPSLEAIYKCKKCGKVNYLMLTDCNSCKDCKAVPIEEILGNYNFEKFPLIEGKLTEKGYKYTVENFLQQKADSLEPATHCCECTKGEMHMVHIQYPDCSCEKEGFVLNRNEVSE